MLLEKLQVVLANWSIWRKTVGEVSNAASTVLTKDVTNVVSCDGYPGLDLCIRYIRGLRITVAALMNRLRPLGY
jgi:hypothetical protein